MSAAQVVLSGQSAGSTRSVLLSRIIPTVSTSTTLERDMIRTIESTTHLWLSGWMWADVGAREAERLETLACRSWTVCQSYGVHTGTFVFFSNGTSVVNYFRSGARHNTWKHTFFPQADHIHMFRHHLLNTLHLGSYKSKLCCRRLLVFSRDGYTLSSKEKIICWHL